MRCYPSAAIHPEHSCVVAGALIGRELRAEVEQHRPANLTAEAYGSTGEACETLGCASAYPSAGPSGLTGSGSFEGAAA